MIKKNIVRIPVDRDFARMFKAHAYANNKTMLQMSREEAQRLKDIYGKGKEKRFVIGYL